LAALIEDRRRGREPRLIAGRFHAAVVAGVVGMTVGLCDRHNMATVVASGGVCQNAILCDGLTRAFGARGLTLWINHAVPPNDGGISLGQAAIAAFGSSDAAVRGATPGGVAAPDARVHGHA
jgi:hydrogenase maturation protein HypF